MEVVASLRAQLDPAVLHATVADLSTYPSWLDIVTAADLVASADGDPGPAWSVVLRGQLGPLRRSKRLRMVRSVDEPPTRVRFERRELDARDHSPWVLEATLDAPVAAGGEVALRVRLHYGGSLWVPILDRVLRDEIERSRPRLVEVASRRPPTPATFDDEPEPDRPAE